MAVKLLDSNNRIDVRDDALSDVQGGDPDTSYTVQQLTPEVTKQLSKKHTTHPINRRTGQRETEVDHLSLMDDLLDAALVGWSGVLAGGESAPCTRANKLLLDFERKSALLRLAGVNQVEQQAAKEGSF